MKRLLLSGYRNPLVFLAIFFGLAFYAFNAAKTLSLDADISALLPKDFQSVEDLKEVKQWFGGIGYVVVVAHGSDPDSLRRFADATAEQTRSIEEVSFVDYKRSVEFFKQRSLYYLDNADLKTIHKRLKNRLKWERNSRNPMYIDLEDEGPPSLEFNDLQQKYQTKNSSWMSSQQNDEAYYFNNNKDLIAIFIKPEMTASNLDFSRLIVDKVTQRLQQLDISQYGPGFQYEITGRYKKQIDLQKQMQTDLGVASSVALALVIFYLLIHFRRPEALVMILLPLIIGILFTFAFAQFAFGQLNILTAFIGVILLGLGIDHGIHLLTRFIDEHRKGVVEEKAILSMLTQTGRAVVVAALTTFVTFIGLCFSEFRAFFEFGLIASAGMVFITLSYLLILPPLIRLAIRFTWNIDAMSAKPKSLGRLARQVENSRKPILIVGLSTVLIFSLLMTQGSFNYDFDSLASSNIRSFELDRQVNDLLGYSQTPMVALTSNKQEERFVSEQFVATNNQDSRNTSIDFTLSTSDLVPLDQDVKQGTISRIQKVLKKVNPSWLEEEEIRQLEDVKRMTQSSPFSYEELPAETRLLFGGDKGQDSAEKGVIMLFPSIKLSDGEKVIGLADELRALKQSDGERIIIAGEAMILADILKLVFSESPTVFSLCGIFIFTILWLFLRSFSYALLCLIPAILTLSTTLGVLAVLGIELNYINILMIPVLLGISVDSGVHMVTRMMEGEHVNEIVSETGTAIFGSILTSGLGIGALLLTDHNGLNSLAQLGTIGLFVNLLVSLLVFPAILSLYQHKRENEAGKTSFHAG